MLKLSKMLVWKYVTSGTLYNLINCIKEGHMQTNDGNL